MKHKDFNRYVDMAMAGRGLDAMRPVVEKELLHYELFNALDSEGTPRSALSSRAFTDRVK